MNWAYEIILLIVFLNKNFNFNKNYKIFLAGYTSEQLRLVYFLNQRQKRLMGVFWDLLQDPDLFNL